MDRYFGPQGRIARYLGTFQPRQGQLEMAKAIDALLQEYHEERTQADVLLIEAETGIGKTLAYLLPSVLSGRRIVVSTATINLQDQILNKEIPLIESLLGENVAAVCVKGRQNYLCLFRWYQYRSSSRLSLVEDDSCGRIERWLQETDTGDRTELDWLPDYSPLWGKISAQSHQCLGGECPESASCFVNALRKKAGSARLLIVNHHLFFSDLSLRKNRHGEILPRYEGVIFDEAHHIENIASTFFGKSFSQYQVIDLAGDVERQAEADLPPSLADRIIHSVRGVKERVDHFSLIFPEAKGRYPLVKLIEEKEDWYDEVKHLASGLERVASELEEFGELGEGWRILARRASQLGESLIEIALPDVVTEGGKQVHWFDKRERSFALSITPVQIAEELQTWLYPMVEFCLLTSATLTTAESFSYVRERLGLDEEIRTLRLQSPFDYAERTRVYVPEKGFPLPSEKNFVEDLCHRVQEILTISKGRALVLCTSFKGMEGIAEFLEKWLPYTVLVQGRGSRNALLRQFQEERDSVLVAVASFWEGVDIPGDSLSCVIIDKLPFESPGDPVLQARIADIRESGGNPFFDFQIPRAILTLKQGVGRLMRSSEDSGVIAIMDGRLFAKGYGRQFRASLPPSPVIRDLDAIAAFYDAVP